MKWCETKMRHPGLVPLRVPLTEENTTPATGRELFSHYFGVSMSLECWSFHLFFQLCIIIGIPLLCSQCTTPRLHPNHRTFVFLWMCCCYKLKLVAIGHKKVFASAKAILQDMRVCVISEQSNRWQSDTFHQIRCHYSFENPKI